MNVKKKFLLPIAVGVVVFGAVTAFAATLTVNSSSLGAGNATVASCNAKAKVTYTNALATTGANQGKYVVATAPVITTDASNVANPACANMGFKVTLLDATNASLGEVTGTLDANGAAVGAGAPNFASSNVLASAVEGIAVVITG